MGILDRMSRLIRANINDMLDKAEDPEKMLNELLREMQSSIQEARVQVANTIAQEKELEAEVRENQQESQDWDRRARMAVQAGKDDLAREALRRKRDADSLSMVYMQQLTSQQDMVTKLKQQLQLLEAKYNEAQSKRDILIARHRAALAQKQMNQTMSSLPGLDKYSELDRMEKKIRGEESQSAAMAELQGENVDWQFAELDRDEDIETELAALKAGGDATPSLTAGAGSVSTEAWSTAGATATAVPATADVSSTDTSSTPSSSGTNGSTGSTTQ